MDFSALNSIEAAAADQALLLQSPVKELHHHHHHHNASSNNSSPLTSASSAASSVPEDARMSMWNLDDVSGPSASTEQIFGRYYDASMALTPPSDDSLAHGQQSVTVSPTNTSMPFTAPDFSASGGFPTPALMGGFHVPSSPPDMLSDESHRTSFASLIDEQEQQQLLQHQQLAQLPMSAFPNTLQQHTPLIQQHEQFPGPQQIMPPMLDDKAMHMAPPQPPPEAIKSITPYSKWVKLTPMTTERVARIKQLANEKGIDLDTVESVLKIYSQKNNGAVESGLNRFCGDDVFIKITMGGSSSGNSANDRVVRRPDGSIVKKKQRKQRPDYVKRPLNSFMLYRKSQTQSAMAYALSSQLKLNHQNISQIIGLMWQTESKELKAEFAKFAGHEKEIHKALHPDYKFCPQKKNKK
ncbi:hypothetical protein TRVA0_027S01530 [Trichomonascus vanleenenianus]|uniref:HMG-box domain-containing protein n=1 Tax=Trichomonascus vanleenenianus TaxID=2268995 RepID=UPI003ECB3B91